LSGDDTKFSVLDFKSKEIVRVLTSHEFELFAMVHPTEFLNQGTCLAMQWQLLNQHPPGWQSTAREIMSPNITKLIGRFNEVGCHTSF
jgi:hypothetical protein